MRSPTDSQPCLCMRLTCPMPGPHLDHRSQNPQGRAQAWAEAKSLCSDKLSPASFLLFLGNLGGAVTWSWWCRPSKEGTRISIMAAKEKCRI